MIGIGHKLEKIIEGVAQLKQVRREEVEFGDVLLITTRNSEYSICALEDDQYLVSGGWFAKKGVSPMKVTITGCTWGGSIVKADALAACGLNLEFGNGVVTTSIQKVRMFRGNGKN